MDRICALEFDYETWKEELQSFLDQRYIGVDTDDRCELTKFVESFELTTGNFTGNDCSPSELMKTYLSVFWKNGMFYSCLTLEKYIFDPNIPCDFLSLIGKKKELDRYIFKVAEGLSCRYTKDLNICYKNLITNMSLDLFFPIPEPKSFNPEAFSNCRGDSSEKKCRGPKSDESNLSAQQRNVSQQLQQQYQLMQQHQQQQKLLLQSQLPSGQTTVTSSTSAQVLDATSIIQSVPTASCYASPDSTATHTARSSSATEEKVVNTFNAPINQSNPANIQVRTASSMSSSQSCQVTATTGNPLLLKPSHCSTTQLPHPSSSRSVGGLLSFIPEACDDNTKKKRRLTTYNKLFNSEAFGEYCDTDYDENHPATDILYSSLLEDVFSETEVPNLQSDHQSSVFGDGFEEEKPNFDAVFKHDGKWNIESYPCLNAKFEFSKEDFLKDIHHEHGGALKGFLSELLPRNEDYL